MLKNLLLAMPLMASPFVNDLPYMITRSALIESFCIDSSIQNTIDEQYYTSDLVSIGLYNYGQKDYCFILHHDIILTSDLYSYEYSYDEYLCDFEVLRDLDSTDLLIYEFDINYIELNQPYTCDYDGEIEYINGLGRIIKNIDYDLIDYNINGQFYYYFTMYDFDFSLTVISVDGQAHTYSTTNYSGESSNLMHVDDFEDNYQKNICFYGSRETYDDDFEFHCLVNNRVEDFYFSNHNQRFYEYDYYFAMIGNTDLYFDAVEYLNSLTHQLEQQLEQAHAMSGVIGLFSTAFSAMAILFNIYIGPGLTLGVLLSIPLVVSIVLFTIELLSKAN